MRCLLCLTTLLIAGCTDFSADSHDIDESSETSETATNDSATDGAAPATVDENVPMSDDEINMAQRVRPEDLVYLGAFRLPAASGGSNWEYSGYAMTYCPSGDPRGADDGFPGSILACIRK